MNILSKFSKLAQAEYKKRHDKVATMVHWEIRSKYGFEPAKHWYEYREEGVTEILKDSNIRADRVIEARDSNIVLINKKNQDTFIIDVAIPIDF